MINSVHNTATATVNVPAIRSLPAKAGIGLKPEHFRQLLDQKNKYNVGFVEIHAENYLVAGGPMHSALHAIREQYPLSIHGVGMSIGGEQALNQHHLKMVAELVKRYQPHAFSEHLAWSTHEGYFLNDLLPLPYNMTTMSRVCEHIDQIQDVLCRPLLLENPSTYLEFKTSTMSETSFISEVIKRTGCGLLLDVSNLYISSVNHNCCPRRMLRELPLKSVGEIHLAGYAENIDAAGDRLLIDSHDTEVSNPVWALYEEVLIHTGAVATLIEWDSNIPPLERLLIEADRAEQKMQMGGYHASTLL